MRSRIVCTLRDLSVLLLLIVSGARIADGQDLDQRAKEPRESYKWGSVFLTNDAIGEILAGLSKDGVAQLVSHREGDKPVSRLKSFLLTGSGRSTAIEFVQIDLVKKRAGYVTRGQLIGVPIEIPWTKGEVIEVAYLIHHLLNEISDYEQAAKAVKDSTTTISDAYNQVKRADSNAGITKSRIPELWSGFCMLVSSKTNELRALEKQNPQLYRLIGSIAMSLVDPVPILRIIFRIVPR